MCTLETERLLLRPWQEEDAEALYRYASDPEVGPSAGWAPHTGVEDSLRVLRTILINDDTWAVTQKGSDEPIGSVGVFPSRASAGEGQPEIGYWLAKPFWGRGYMPEAVRALIDRCFARGAEAVWCGHFPTNDKSRRVIEKCGFRYRFTEEYTGSDGLTRPSMYYSILREDWQR